MLEEENQQLYKSYVSNLERSYSKSYTVKPQETDKKEKKKRGNFIFRQELSSYTPECNPKCGIIFNLILFSILSSIGLFSYFKTKNIFEFKYDYTNW